MAGSSNLVLSLLVLGGGAVFVWSGITDPADGTLAGIRRAMAGEPATRRTSGRPGFLTTLAGLTPTPSTGGGGRAAARYNLGPVQPHVAKAAGEVAPLFGIRQVLGVGERPTPGSDHPNGLALDFMVTDERGTALAAYVLANGRRLGVTYVIWRQRINSRDGRGWRAMEDRGSPTANHMDHVHVSFAPRGAAA